MVDRTGPNKWRDTQKPKEILDDYCKKNNIPGPFYYGATKVTVDGKMYNLADFGKIVLNLISELYSQQSILIENSNQTIIMLTINQYYVEKN